MGQGEAVMENNLQHRQFFHGTAAKLQPGDLIHPNHLGEVGHNKNNPEHSDFVWMTNRLSDADWYARHRGSMVNDGTKPTKEKARQNSHVYEVEPQGLHAPADIESKTPQGKTVKHKSNTAHVSLAPAKVLREVPPEERG